RPAAERADETSRELADQASPLDQAMSEIAERQRALDGEAGPGRLSQNLSGLEDQLRQINAQIETMRPCSLDSPIETLRDDLAEIGRMLKEAMPRKAIEALETEVRSLALRGMASLSMRPIRPCPARRSRRSKPKSARSPSGSA